MEGFKFPLPEKKKDVFEAVERFFQHFDWEKSTFDPPYHISGGILELQVKRSETDPEKTKEELKEISGSEILENAITSVLAYKGESWKFFAFRGKVTDFSVPPMYKQEISDRVGSAIQRH